MPDYSGCPEDSSPRCPTCRGRTQCVTDQHPDMRSKQSRPFLAPRIDSGGHVYAKQILPEALPCFFWTSVFTPRHAGVYSCRTLGEGCEQRFAGMVLGGFFRSRTMPPTRTSLTASGSIALWRLSCSLQFSTTIGCGYTSTTRCIIPFRMTRSRTRTRLTASRNLTRCRRGVAHWNVSTVRPR